MKSIKSKRTIKSTQKVAMVTIGFVLLIIIFILLQSNGKMNNVDYLVSINDAEVSEDEFRLFLQDQKASVAAYFYQEYGVEDSIDFWETRVEGETPIEVAREQAISELLRIKIEQEIALEYGLLESLVFEDIIEDISEEENRYGADNLSLFQEYTLYHSKILIDTVNRFKAEFNKVQDQEVKEYYKQHQNTLFKEADHVETIQIEIEQTEEENELFDRIQLDLKSDQTISELQEKYKKFDQINIKGKEYASQVGKDEDSSELEMQLKEVSYMMQIGEISEVIPFGNRDFIVKVISKEQGNYRDYEEVKETIASVIIEENFEQEVIQRVNDAKISLNEKAIQNIDMK